MLDITDDALIKNLSEFDWSIA